jgi:hypothetical protein
LLEQFARVMPGLVPGMTLGWAQRIADRDGRDKLGHDGII